MLQDTREIRLQLNALLMANRIPFLGVVKYLLASEVQQLLGTIIQMSMKIY